MIDDLDIQRAKAQILVNDLWSIPDEHLYGGLEIKTDYHKWILENFYGVRFEEGETVRYWLPER